MFKSKENSKNSTINVVDNINLKKDGRKTTSNYISKISDIVIESSNLLNTNTAVGRNPMPGIIASIGSDGYKLYSSVTRDSYSKYTSEIIEIADMNDVKAKDVYNQFLTSSYRKMCLDFGLKTILPIVANTTIKTVTENKKDTPISYALKSANIPRLVGMGLSELIDKQLVKNDIKKFEKSGEEGKKIGSLYYSNKLGDTQYSKDSKSVNKGKIVGSILTASAMGGLAYVSKYGETNSKPISEIFVVIDKTEGKVSPTKSKVSTTNKPKTKK